MLWATRPEAALAEVEALPEKGLETFLPFQAVRADLLRRAGRTSEARAAYAAALALDPAPAERRFLAAREAGLGSLN